MFHLFLTHTVALVSLCFVFFFSISVSLSQTHSHPITLCHGAMSPQTNIAPVTEAEASTVLML